MRKKMIREQYENIEYMGRVQTFTYFATQENEFGDDIILYNGEPDSKNMAATLSRKTLETLLKIQETYKKGELEKSYNETKEKEE